MTIHFYTFSTEMSGTSRQRAFRIAEELESRGFKTVIHRPPVLAISTTRWPKKFVLIIQTIRSLFSIKKDDFVFLQRAIANKYFFVIMVCYLKIFRRKMIFDFDDPVYTHSFTKTKVFTQMADAVIVCTHGQAQWAKQYNHNVHIIHISIEFSEYEKFTKDYSIETKPSVIGWVGTGTEHLRNLEILASVFRKLLATYTTAFSFTLVGALKDQRVYKLFQDIKGLEVKFIDSLVWNDPESVPREIQKFDIGVLPHRSDGEWNQSKTSLKNLQYMACAVPAVCSAFGEMPFVYSNGVNGYIVKTEDEWIEVLTKLLKDKSLRERIGRAGQQLVREQYSYDAIIPRIIEIIRGVEHAL
ncbi:MAG TPA: glycosyltransferase family 4 protein [Candidatus Paceibacterota bacterium]|nr:glycosyltransferase family 4 protein [Candidatus Paceibacterota bacterium]